MTKSKYRFFSLCVVAIICAAFSYNSFPQSTPDGLNLTFVDVGQGDCIFVKAPNGKTMLVDAGESDEFHSRLRPFLISSNIDTIDVLVASHYHSDHIGAMENIFANFNVKTLIVPDYKPRSKAKVRLLKAADSAGTEVIEVSEGDFLPEISKGLSLSVLHPDKSCISDNENDNSLVLLLKYFKTTALLTGDVEAPAEKTVAEKYDIESDILKVAHHGSSTSTCKEFLSAANPTYAVIQCGKDNGYGHPHHETLSALDDDDVRVYRTDIDQNITFYLSEKGIEKIKTTKF